MSDIPGVDYILYFGCTDSWVVSAECKIAVGKIDFQIGEREPGLVGVQKFQVETGVGPFDFGFDYFGL